MDSLEPRYTPLRRSPTFCLLLLPSRSRHGHQPTGVGDIQPVCLPVYRDMRIFTITNNSFSGRWAYFIMEMLYGPCIPSHSQAFVPEIKTPQGASTDLQLQARSARRCRVHSSWSLSLAVLCRLSIRIASARRRSSRHLRAVRCWSSDIRSTSVARLVQWPGYGGRAAQVSIISPG